MQRIGRWFMGAALAAASVGGVRAAESAKPGPKIEVVFVLDTTGSMGGLLEGAKSKIWSIVNEMAKGKPLPQIKMGLVAYRDRGDAYLTKITPLTKNLDAVYADLLALKADGGGDTPEDVKSGMRDAVEKMAWSSDKRTAKLVFLVGDAPPHEEYTDTPPMKKIVEAAVRKGLRLNTIRCGSDPQTGTAWETVARLGEGKFFTIGSDGGVASISTPFDGELARMNVEFDGTALPFGAGRREEAARKSMVAGMLAAAPAAASADRAVYEAKAGFASREDLLDAVENRGLDIRKVKKEDLPKELAGKDADELRAALKETKAKREALQNKIAELSKERDAFIAKEKAKTGKKDSFDSKVVEALKEEVKETGVSF